MTIDISAIDGCSKFSVVHNNVDDSDGSIDVLFIDMAKHSQPGFIAISVWQHGMKAPHGNRGITGHGSIMLSMEQAFKLHADLGAKIQQANWNVPDLD